MKNIEKQLILIWIVIIITGFVNTIQNQEIDNLTKQIKELKHNAN